MLKPFCIRVIGRESVRDHCKHSRCFVEEHNAKSTTPGLVSLQRSSRKPDLVFQKYWRENPAFKLAHSRRRPTPTPAQKKMLRLFRHPLHYFSRLSHPPHLHPKALSTSYFSTSTPPITPEQQAEDVKPEVDRESEEESGREMVEMWNPDAPKGPEWGGPRGYEPTKHGDWAKKGRVSDF